MSNVKKLMMTAAGGGDALNVEDVFSTYLYEGNGLDRTITNGVDLSTEGGLVWIKRRGSGNHFWFDTARTLEYSIQSNETDGESFRNETVEAYNTDGFDLGTGSNCNASGGDFAAWTFRKAPKFFDIVTYTGDGTSGRSISHNLGSAPGMVVIKNLSRSSDWHTWHRELTSISYGFALNRTYTEFTNGAFLTATPTSTTVTIKNPGYDGAGTNNSGDSYVMYLFAHNDGDGEYGPSGDQDIIKCGSYTGNGNSNGPEVDLGFNPQWIMIKEATSVSGNGSWFLFDVMRGANEEGYDYMGANFAGHNYLTNPYLVMTPTGFKIRQNDNTLNENGQNYVFVAIRSRNMGIPEDATDVFDVGTYTGNSNARSLSTAFHYDLAMIGLRNAASAKYVVASRPNGRYFMFTGTSNSELNDVAAVYDNAFGFGDTFLVGNASGNDWTNETGKTYVNYGWKKAGSYFDVCSYTGNGTAGRTVSHSLGVAPDMMWVKKRNQTSNWEVYLHSEGGTKRIYLDVANAIETTSAAWNNTDASATEFTLGTSSQTNQNGGTFIAYLFATAAGVSKVGTYTGDGTTGRTIDCGFSSGARFIIIKRLDSSGDWYVWDTGRGISTGNNPRLTLNTNGTEVTSDQTIDPASSGFIVNQVPQTNVNVSSASYMFYAIA